MRRIALVLLFTLISAGLSFVVTGCCEKIQEDLATGFECPQKDTRPWCYYISFNGHFDKPTIDADIARMDSIGFGGVLFTDISGYHDGGEEHLNLPKREKEWMGKEWLSDLKHLARRLNEHNMQLSMNISAHGGSMKGPWDNGKDAPKMLVYHISRPGSAVADPNLKNFVRIASYAVRFESQPDFSDVWKTAAGGPANLANDKNLKSGTTSKVKALEVKQLLNDDFVPSSFDWAVLNVGYGSIPGYEYDLDVLDKAAVKRYLEKMSDLLKEELGPLFGKTLTHYYSVSWEGSAPTWSISFADDFRKYAGYDIMPWIPSLCGFEISGDDNLIHDFRKARNEMFLQNFYHTMSDVSHQYGLKVFSESGGPWTRTPEALLDADQHRFLAINDMPQGEFWLAHNYLGRTKEPVMHIRGAASAAHTYGKRLVSAEAFTHMTYHWSAYPARLKPLADQAFIDGCNHLVWHTYTSSPAEFGVPGLEFFAGTHINRNVTWQKDAGEFLTYLARCQYLLRQGSPVSDIAVWAGDRVYQDYGDYIDKPYDGSNLNLPKGYPYDVINTETLMSRSRVADGKLELDGGMSYSVLCVDPQFEDCMTAEVIERLKELEKMGLNVVFDKQPKCSFHPDVESRFEAIHRRMGPVNIYFVKGNGRDEAIFRASSSTVQIWEPVSGKIYNADASELPDGRTKVNLDLPENGSVFVVFGANQTGEPQSNVTGSVTINGPWKVSFKYMDGVKAKAPEPKIWNELKDLTEDDDFDVKHFSGDVKYSTTFAGRPDVKFISLGSVLGGIATVYVNGHKCGQAWTAPWKVDVSGCVHDGENKLEIVYTGCWANRLIGDCLVTEKERVARTNVRVGRGSREWRHHPTNPYSLWWPSVYSRFLDTDPLMPSGVIGPVCLEQVQHK